MKISYDYSELIKELKEELREGVLTEKSTIKVVRIDRKEVTYRPIVDWYYMGDDTKEDTEIMEVGEVLKEMEDMNEII